MGKIIKVNNERDFRFGHLLRMDCQNFLSSILYGFLITLSLRL
jgi:hypothetical protein